MPATGVLFALGIDVGLSGVRAAVVRADGALAGAARRGHARPVRAPGVAEHDPQDWLEGVRATARTAVAEAGGPRVGAVGIAALGPAPLLVDAALEPLTPAPLFSLDARAAAQRERLRPEGGAAVADHALPHLRRMVDERPELLERAAWALDATGFLVSRCVGAPVMDAVTRCDHVWEGAEPVAPLPPPVDPGAVAGGLSADGAELLGLEAGVPVPAGTYDSFVDLAGAGVAAPGDAGIVLGSTMIVGVVCAGLGASAHPGVVAAGPRAGLGASTHPGVAAAAAAAGLGVSAFFGGTTLVGGWTLNGGNVLEWGGRTLAGDPVALRREAAALEPGAGGLRVLPYLAGERTPVCDLSARGAVEGLSLDTTPAMLYRGLVDALALALRDHAARLPGAPPPRWRVTGGGVRNEAWLQAVADALGAPLDVVAHAGEAVGPALLAFAAVGAQAERAVVRTVTPDLGRARRFDALYDDYRRLHPAVRAVHDATPDDDRRAAVTIP